MTAGKHATTDAEVLFLMYHGIDSDEEPSELTEPGDLLYVTDRKVFEAGLAFLRSEGFRTILLRDFLDWQQGKKDIPAKSVVITFDDGHSSNVKTALPILVRHRLVAEFFITTGRVGKPHHVTAADVARLRDAGMGIGSHSVTHPLMNDLPTAAIRDELVASKRFLETTSGVEVIGFSAPGGRTPDALPELARAAGYEAVLTSRPGSNGRRSDPYRLNRIAMRRGVPISRRLASHGRPGAADRLIHGLFELGKKGLGNEMYDRVRAGILRVRHGSRRSAE